MNVRKMACALAALILVVGCTTTITNLTPSTLPRSVDNLYPFEVALETSQATIREDSLKAYVLIGTELYPMRSVEQLKNRWEAMVPVPAATNHVYYRYKFDYEYDKIGAPSSSSRLSGTYQLEIVDK